MERDCQERYRYTFFHDSKGMGKTYLQQNHATRQPIC